MDQFRLKEIVIAVITIDSTYFYVLFFIAWKGEGGEMNEPNTPLTHNNPNLSFQLLPNLLYYFYDFIFLFFNMHN